MTRFVTRVLESWYVDPLYVNHRDIIIYRDDIMFDEDYKQHKWYKWLFTNNINFKLQQADHITRYIKGPRDSEGGIPPSGKVQCFLEIVFERKKDQILFELTWKGRYDV